MKLDILDSSNIREFEIGSLYIAMGLKNQEVNM